MKLNQVCIGSAFCVLLLHSFLPGLAYGLRQVPSKSEVLSVVSERKRAIDNFHAQWEEMESYPNGSIAFFSDDKPGEFVTDHVELSNHYSLDVSGTRVRISISGQSWQPPLGKFVTGEKIAVFDDETATLYQSKYNEIAENDSPPTGIIGPIGKKRSWSERYPSTQPIKFWYDMSGVLSDPKSTVGPALVESEGCQCVRIVRQTTTRLKETWLLDVDRNYIPVFYEWAMPGTFVTQARVDFEPHDETPSVKWIPSKWTVMQTHGSGKSGSTKRAIIKELKVNTVMPEGNFDFEFPIATRVTDHRGGAKSYVVRENQKKRPITGFDRGKTYQEILASSPYPQKRFGLKWVLVVLLVALIVGYFFMRRYQNVSHNNH